MISGLRPNRSRQPAGDQRHRHGEHDQRAVHQAGRRLVEADHLGQVDQREQVDHAEPAAPATQHGRQVQPAAGRGRAGCDRRPSGRLPSARAAARSVPRSRTNSRIAIAMTMAGMPKTIDAPRQPTNGDERRADQRDDDGPDVAPRDVGADREPAAFAAGTARRAGRCRPGAAASHRCATGCSGSRTTRTRWPAPAARTRHRTGSRRSRAAGAATRPGSAPRSSAGPPRARKRPDRREEGHGLHPDAELVDDLEEDQRQQRPPGRG